MKPKISKADQAAHTRTALLRAGRTLFADQGYANTPTESIVRRAGVTRGALARLVWGPSSKRRCTSPTLTMETRLRKTCGRGWSS